MGPIPQMQCYKSASQRLNPYQGAGPPPPQRKIMENIDDNWVCCDNCDKWRLLSTEAFRIVTKVDGGWKKFYCADTEGASCQDPSEETDPIVDAQVR